MIKEQAINFFNTIQSGLLNNDSREVASSLVLAYLKSMVAAITSGKEEPYDDETKASIDNVVSALICDSKDFYDVIITDEICAYVDHMIDLIGIVDEADVE